LAFSATFMPLSPQQNDALSELIHLGFGRAAAALSDMTGQRIKIEAPKADVRHTAAVAVEIGLSTGRFACVAQPFHGPISGHALLLLEQSDAKSLVRILGVQSPGDHEMDAESLDTITEIGNILLNACIGVFDHLFGVAVSFDVPRTTILAADVSLPFPSEPSASSIVLVHTRLHLTDGSVRGYVVLMPGATSLDRLLYEVTAWEQRHRMFGPHMSRTNIGLA
jgi:chemotaxis protein CheC